MVTAGVTTMSLLVSDGSTNAVPRTSACAT
jgi:hypothetical protein